MKTKIEIEIDSVFAPYLYGLLNEEMKAAKELANDEEFAKMCPHLTKRAHLTVRNLTAILDKLGEEF
jgi:hypothetical protein